MLSYVLCLVLQCVAGYYWGRCSQWLIGRVIRATPLWALPFVFLLIMYASWINTNVILIHGIFGFITLVFDVKADEVMQFMRDAAFIYGILSDTINKIGKHMQEWGSNRYASLVASWRKSSIQRLGWSPT